MPAPEREPAASVTLSRLPASDKLITSASVNTGTVEQYRRLAAQLYLSQAERGTRTIMVASALPGEGKTLTAANLALTLSESYQRKVLLVDGDLRRPCAHHLFEVPNVTGLNDGIRAEVERRVPLIRVTEHLSLLTAGRPDSDPMSVLSSDRMSRVLEEAREKFEWVIIDTPPLGVLTDANLLASMVDAAVLVVQAGKTPTAAVRRVVEAIGRDRIAGVVLNRVSAEQVVTEYAGYYEPADQQV
jgi:capsular exopolysaccharide synthesis family protein